MRVILSRAHREPREELRHEAPDGRVRGSTEGSGKTMSVATRRAVVFLSVVTCLSCGSRPDAGPSNNDADGGGGQGKGSLDRDASTPSGKDAASSPNGGDSGAGPDALSPNGTAPVIAGCPILPSNHIFNVPIDSLAVHANSAAFLNTIGSHNVHLDLGTSVDTTSPTYYGIPYNVTHGNSATWAQASYSSSDPSLSWDPTQESDCAVGSAHTIVAPCLASAAPQPVFPIPASPLVEGGLVTDPTQPYGDHHILIIDADTCRLWELYHCYPRQGGWDIFGSATFDLGSNNLRPDGWTSADAAGFPILPLLLRADEASAGAIHHALRFTIQSSKIRNAYVWPARHLTTNGSASQSLPPMGQLFRLRAIYPIPASYNTQARAILQALKTYGMYIADGGSDMYISGEPNGAWADATISQVQSVGSSQFEAVDLSPITRRPGFNANSAAVPP
jgi:hypothetical protein